MAARGAGAFLSGMSDGLMMGQERKDRVEDRALRERELDIMEQQVANGGYGTPGYYGASPATGPGGWSGGSAPPADPRRPVRGANPTGGNGMSNEFLGLIDRTEGGGRYDTLYGHSQRQEGPFAGVDVSRMTIGEAIEFSNPSGPYAQWVRNQVGRVATPMGRYQIVGRTLRNAVNQMGLPMDAPFNAQTQDQIAMHLARNAYDRAGVSGLRSEWEGLRSVDTATLESAVRGFLTN